MLEEEGSNNIIDVGEDVSLLGKTSIGPLMKILLLEFIEETIVGMKMIKPL